jgi:uncharacterized caspase-like protein
MNPDATRWGWRLALRHVVGAVCAILLAALCASARAQTPPDSGVRVALVIGNGAYRSIERLANPVNDAVAIATRLEALGFELVGDGPQMDLDRAGFERALESFRKQIRRADVALFFYAGHGVQIAGVNWLVPVSASPRIEADIARQMINANDVLALMKSARAKLNVVILDACRDDPFAAAADSPPPPAQTPTPLPTVKPTPSPPPGKTPAAAKPATRGAGGGLGRMDAPDNTLIAYATQPGNVALDGGGGNSPYSKALAETIGLPGLEIRRVFNEVGVRVRRATNGEQQPWLSASPIEREVYLAGRPSNLATQPASPELNWAIGTWQGRIVDYPRSWEAERAYAVANADGRLKCFWQVRGAPQEQISCAITSDEVAIATGSGAPNVKLRRDSDKLLGTYVRTSMDTQYRMELKRVSTAIVRWPDLSTPQPATADNRWAVGVWAGQIQDYGKGKSAGRELKIEVVDEAIRCLWRDVAVPFSPVPCAISDRTVLLRSRGGSDIELTRTGAPLSGTLRVRASQKTYRLSLQKRP